MATFTPRNEQEIVDVIKAAIANASAIDIIGSGSRIGLGHPPSAQNCLNTTLLSGVIYYEPSELVLTAHAGTPLSSITEMLDQHNQEMTFEPIDHGPLFGIQRGSGTIGGLVAVNASGPRRIMAGAARDHVLGFRAISGRGEVFQSGGRVMKNVTGYDMSKLMTGAYGTFGIFSEITIKVMPKAETELTLLVVGLDEDTAIKVMTDVTGLAYEISGFAHLPCFGDDITFPVPPALADKSLTAFRLEGSKNSIKSRQEELGAYLRDNGRQIEVLDALTSKEFWADLRDVIPFHNTQDQIWRISTAPTNGSQLVRDLFALNIPVNGHYYDWAGGLIWLAVAPADDAHEPTLREVVNGHGGHATLIRASDEVRAITPVFHPQQPALAALTKRIRHSFDPQLILNPGRVRDDL